MVDNDIQKRELVDLEGVVETNLEHEKNLMKKIILLQNLKIAIGIMRRLIWKHK